MAPEYREEPCRSALNRVKGMRFEWSLNPYMGCVHRCTFCYVRAFERRADRPSDDRYGTSIRVKVNVAEVLRRELARASWEREPIAIGAATDPYQPAEGRYRLTRACLEALAEAHNPFGIITRGPMIVRDIDVLVEAARRADVSVTFSIPTLDDDVWRKTEPSTAHPRQRLNAVQKLVEAGVKAGCRHGADPSRDLRQARAAPRSRQGSARGRRDGRLDERPLPAPGHARALPRAPRRGLARAGPHYEALYRRRAYLPAEETKPVRRQVSALARELGVADRRAQPARAAARARAARPRGLIAGIQSAGRGRNRQRR